MLAVERRAHPQGPENAFSASRKWDWYDYHSVFSYRYGSKEMRRTWSEGHKTELMADVWIAVAAAQHKVGLVTDEELNDLVDHKPDFVARIDEVLDREMNRKNTKYKGHDIVAAISVYSEVAPIGARVIHRGLTSEDVLSNVEAIQMIESIQLVNERMKRVLARFGDKVEEYKDLPALGLTHLQAAEPVSLGLRLAVFAQDFLTDFDKVQSLGIKGKGIKGPVGTSAEVDEILKGTGMSPKLHEQVAMQKLDLDAYPVTGQTAPRKSIVDVLGVLAGIGTSAKRFGMNMRLYQSSLFNELAEPRDPNDVGSSAMPHKRNPRHSENIMSLSRGIKLALLEAEEIAEEVPAERGIDDSAGKRAFLPEAFLRADEVLRRVESIVDGLVVHKSSLWRNLHNFALFTTAGPILSLVTREGANREEMHKKLFELAGQAYESLSKTGVNNFGELVKADEDLSKYATDEQIQEIIDTAEVKFGTAPGDCDNFLENYLRPALAQAA